jgi:hypothetical protein
MMGSIAVSAANLKFHYIATHAFRNFKFKRRTKAGSARMDPSLRAHSEAKGEAIQK